MHGGHRKGAGRRAKKGESGVSHKKRLLVSGREPGHVTARVLEGLGSLRCRDAYRVLKEVFQKVRALGVSFRLVHYSVQGDHLHLLMEAKDRVVLSRKLQGLFIRIAKALNKLWKRRGTVFADRYHEHVLTTPREAWNALRYVMNNDLKHKRRRRQGWDEYSSGAWFDGWRERVSQGPGWLAPVARARSWLLRVGWRRRGLIGLFEVPGR